MKKDWLTSNIPNELAWGIIGFTVAAFVATFLSFQAGIFVLLFLIIGYYLWQHPENGFLMLIVVAPILPMLKITATISTLTILKDVIILLLFVKVFLLPLKQKTLPYRRSILFWPIIMLIGWTAFATLQADSLLLGILRARDIVLYLLLYFVALYLPISRKILKERLIWFLAAVLTVLLLGAYQWFFAADSAVLRFDPVREIWIPRISSIMAHPSILGQYLVIATSIFVAIATFASRRAVRIGSVIISFLLMIFIFLTYSRAVWLGLTASLGVMFLAVIYIKLFSGYFKKINKIKLINTAGMVIAALFIILLLLMKFTPAGGLIRSAVDPTYGSNQERIEFMVRLVAPQSNTQGVIGRGLGNVTAQQFRTVDIEAYDIATGSGAAVKKAKDRTLVDNQYLKTFIEMGLIGLLIYAWIFWISLKNAWLITIRHDNVRAKVIGLSALGIFTAFVLQGFFVDVWEIWPTNAIFWIMAGLVSIFSFQNLPRKADEETK